MTWTPCQRIVRADIPPSLRLRGISSDVMLCWPNAALNGAADYSVDFSGQICCDDEIREAAFSVQGGTPAWVSVFGGKLATAWISWTASGPQSVEVTALTASGATLTVRVAIVVLTDAALLPADAQIQPPNTLLLSDGTELLLSDDLTLLTN